MQWAAAERQDPVDRRRQGSTGSSPTPPSIRCRSRGRSTSTSAAATPAARTRRSCSASSSPSRPPTGTGTPASTLMDSQQIEGAMFLPTLGVGMEQALIHDVPAAVRRLPGLQPLDGRGLGFRLPGADLRRPGASPLADPGRGRGRAGVGARPRRPVRPACCRVRSSSTGRVARRPTRVRPVLGPPERGRRHRHLPRRRQPVLARTSPTGARRRRRRRSARTRSGRWHRRARSRTRSPTCWPTTLFERFPNLRIAAVETGSDWVFHLFEKLKKSFGQTPLAYPEDPAGDLPPSRVGVPVLRGRARRAPRPDRRRADPDGLGLPPRRGSGRAESRTTRTSRTSPSATRTAGPSCGTTAGLCPAAVRPRARRGLPNSRRASGLVPDGVRPRARRRPARGLESAPKCGF